MKNKKLKINMGNYSPYYLKIFIEEKYKSIFELMEITLKKEVKRLCYHSKVIPPKKVKIRPEIILYFD